MRHVLYTYDKQNDNSTDTINFGGGIPLPEDSTKNPLIYLGVGINLIYNRLNTLEKKIHGFSVPIKRI